MASPAQDGIALRGLRSRTSAAEWAAYGAVALVGAFLYWLSEVHPGQMPDWAPWEFSPPEYLSIALVAVWFFRGLALQPAGERPDRGHRIAFFSGLALVYAVLQTRYDYWAQHLFFFNRVQHVVMHHVGPFLIAFAAAGGTIERGMPGWARRVIHSRLVAWVYRGLQQPLLAGFLFVASFFFWLIPPVHFRAMTDGRLYAVMNWTMVLDGILFWSLVLDLRPRPPARLSYAGRVGLIIGVMIPQGFLGLLLTFWPRELYPYYDLCGRILPSISARFDQRLGGMAIWVPPGVVCMAGVLRLLVTSARRRQARAGGDQDPLRTG